MTDRDRLTEIEAANNTFIGPGYDGTGAQQLVSDIAWLIARVRELEADVEAANDCCDGLEVMHYQALERVKALEADRARLDWLLSTCITDLPGKVEAWDTFYHLTREMIDAAMTAANRHSDK